MPVTLSPRRGVRGFAARGVLAATVLLAPSLSGCGLLDVNDPTRVEESDLGNATSADLMRQGAIAEMMNPFTTDAKLSGLLSDEFFGDPVTDFPLPTLEEYADRRESEQFELLMGGVASYYNLHSVRRTAAVALPFVRQYMLEPVRSAYVTQLLAIRGFGTLTLAEHYCPGFPLNDLVNGLVVRTGPVTTAEAFERALADFDSAIALNTDSARYLNLARIGKARALLGLGRIDEAGPVVADVPTDYEYSLSVESSNRLFTGYSSSRIHIGAANREGGNGLDYVSSNDPRVELVYRGLAFNGVDSIYQSVKYPDRSAPFVIANGIEARLIEAESALRTGGDWRGILNELRRDYTSLSDTTDPGTDAARVDLLFRERAFWLFATGHRLGDLRRLIAYYNRTPETIFPVGPSHAGGGYGSATSLPMHAAAEHADDPAVTGCTTR